VAEDLLWAYCVVDGSAEPPAAAGVDGGHAVEAVSEAGLTAFVSRVPASEFGAQALTRNLNDIRWLERVARAHEAVLELALGAATIVPLRMCTLYETPDSVRRMLDQEQAALSAALGALAGREEWSVKLLVDPERLEAAAQQRVTGAEPVADAQSEAGAYLQRRRLERQVRELAQLLAADAADALRAGLVACALAMVTRPGQNPELSGLRGRMILNAALLVDADGVDHLRAVAAGVEADRSDLGAQVVVTGPWPPFNFVPGSDAAVPA
jgi:gas vesicle protein GvpL/GvpF